MKMVFRYDIFCMLYLLLFVTHAAAEDWRVWTDRKDQKITAQLVSVEGDAIKIRAKNNRIYSYTINVLSDTDRAYIKRRALLRHSPGGQRAFPEFSWDRIPLYMHIRKATAYTDQEIAFIAKFPLITFEKSNGSNKYGSTEKGTLFAARRVKKLNPKAKILYYRNVFVHYGGYAANKELNQIPGALLNDRKGGTDLVRDRVSAYDLSNEQVRSWWVDHGKQMSDDPAIDGLFLDGSIKALEPAYLRRDVGQNKKQQVAAGYFQMMEQTRQAMASEKLMIANILRARFENGGLEYMDHFDGAYLEGFFHEVGRLSYEHYVAKGIVSMQKAAQQGKIIAFTSGLAASKNVSTMGIDALHGEVKSDEQAHQAFNYSLAVFLICAEKYSYFRVHEGYSANGNKRWMRWFKEYDKPLGPPKGPAEQKGYVYTREFEHASVSLDISERRGVIRWR